MLKRRLAEWRYNLRIMSPTSAPKVDSAPLRTQAASLGFNLIGLTRAVPSPHLAAYERWIAADLHGDMAYMARPDRVARRRDLNVILPGVRSLIMVGLDYQTLRLPAAIADDPRRGRIASYAWAADYHAIMTPRLEILAGWLRDQQSGAAFEHRVYVDTGAILERDHAQAAGLGFSGKNTLLIHPRRGSYFFLGEILTDLEFADYDSPMIEPGCGRCTRCLNACPTDAFPAPHVLDARRCISYLTIEHKREIDPTLRRQMGNWVYGCDVCQAVCPWNRFAVQTLETNFYPIDFARAAPPLIDLLHLDDDGFRDRFADSAIERVGRDRLVRNACIAAGNSGLVEFTNALAALAASDRSALVREAATWALAHP